MNWEKTLLITASVLLLTVMLYSGFRLMEINYHSGVEQELQQEMLAFRPSLHMDEHLSYSHTLGLTGEGHHDFLWYSGEERRPVINPSLIELQATHENVVGWLYVPNTRVDHPFVRYDNEFYLSHDLNHNRTPNGAIFMDERNLPDFTEYHTIVYGHNMRNGSMFGTLRDFTNRDFFIANRYAYIFLPHITYQMEIFAVAVIRPYDSVIYGLQSETVEERQEFINYIRRVAQHTRPYMEPAVWDRFVTLSTCRNDAADSRIVVIGVITEY